VRQGPGAGCASCVGEAGWSCSTRRGRAARAREGEGEPRAHARPQAGGDAVLVRPGFRRARCRGKVALLRRYADARRFRTRRARCSPGRQARLLGERDRVLRRVRQFFWARDFCEVETRSSVRRQGSRFTSMRGARAGSYLITSPEYQMKRLLVGGMQRIFQSASASAGTRRTASQPEFTMLEWYRVGFTYETLMEDCEPARRAGRRCARFETTVRATHHG